MVLVWPSSLMQYPLVDGFNHQHEPNLIKAPTETGPGKTRPKQSHSPITVSATTVCDTQQKYDLVYFYETVTQYGSFPFVWVGLDESLDGQGHGYRFSEPPSFRPFGIEWKTSLNLQAWTPSGDAAVTLALVGEGLTVEQAGRVTFYANFEKQTYMVEQ